MSNSISGFYNKRSDKREDFVKVYQNEKNGETFQHPKRCPDTHILLSFHRKSHTLEMVKGNQFEIYTHQRESDYSNFFLGYFRPKMLQQTIYMYNKFHSNNLMWRNHDIERNFQLQNVSTMTFLGHRLMTFVT